MGILITGATGFIGNNLIRCMLEWGYHSSDIILLIGKEDKQLSDAGYRILLHRNYSYATDELRSLLHPGEQIDAVIHLGAATPKGMRQDEEIDFEENVRTTEHLLNTLPNIPGAFILGSSVSVYNTDISTPDGRYGKSKLACEQLLTDSLLKTRLWIMRFGPVYGPGEETYQKIAGSFLKKAMAGEDIMLRGDGSAVRNMVYVGDLCKRILKPLERMAPRDSVKAQELHVSDIVNEESITILQLACCAARIAGSTSRIFTEAFGEVLMDGRDYACKEAEGTSYWEGMQLLYNHLLEQDRC